MRFYYSMRNIGGASFLIFTFWSVFEKVNAARENCTLGRVAEQKTRAKKEREKGRE